jgi:hypothetical protein
MTLTEYYEGFQRFIGVADGSFPRHVAAEVAAAHDIGLTFEQLKQFLACRTEITSVAVALTTSTLSAAVIERILRAKQQGAVHPTEILSTAFSADEIQEKFHAEVFGRRGGDA